MAIVIPSKYIYSKSFDPVIDNNISKVEVTQKEITTYLNTKNVYTESITNGFKEADLQSAIDTKFDGFGSYSYFCVAYVSETPQYITKKISIPQRLNNDFVIRLLTGKNDDGTNNIQYNIVGDITVGTVIGSIYGDSTVSDDCRFTNLYIDDNPQGNPKPIEENQSYTLTKEITDIKKTTQISTPFVDISAEVDFVLKDETNILTASAQLVNGKYEITLTILCGLTIKALTGELSNTSGKGIIPLSGEYYRYLPKQVEISLNGDTISLNVQDDVETISDGNKVFSFDGNELIQTTNTPSAKSKYQTIIDEWRNGKQTAVISCPIADYYDENGNKVIDTAKSGKMLFGIGDIVIPYVYTNKGDKPLSYNRDFTPKRFKVVGTKISKRQGGMQELTLQEV